MDIEQDILRLQTIVRAMGTCRQCQRWVKEDEFYGRYCWHCFRERRDRIEFGKDIASFIADNE